MVTVIASPFARLADVKDEDACAGTLIPFICHW
jgi:hypothetical protein